jgi:hypothetical protein
MAPKTLSVHGDNGKFRVVSFIQSRLRKYAKSILACTENTLKAFKRLRRIPQEYFAVYGEYADRHKIEPISANFRPKPKKIQILNPYYIQDRIGKKTISRYTVPLKVLGLEGGRDSRVVSIEPT